MRREGKPSKHQTVAVQLPKDALQKVQLGQSFAEYDLIREHPTLFVSTAASLAVTQPDNKKCFLVGRRGAGKTAIAYHILEKNRRAVSIIPQVFDLVKLPLANDEFRDTRQRPFKSLVCALERALLGELISQWKRTRVWDFNDATPSISKERGLIENCNFDLRVLNLISELFEAYANPNEKLWLRQINRSKDLILEVNNARQNANFDFVLLIDRLDESWDGSESAVISLMALMHACVRIIAACPSLRPFLFVRENIFSRVRQQDNEFSRLETSVVYLDWTSEKLTELVERRFVRPFNTKPALGGEAWSYFFEDGPDFDSRREVFTFCQNRPRDVLTYVSFALEAAIGKGHAKITRDDVRGACERFSTSKLKDVADEFSENYPNIQLVLEFFYGLSTEYTITAIENFIQKLLVDQKIARYCRWFFDVTAPHEFIGLLFSIGFVGVRDGDRVIYKTSSGDLTVTPTLGASSVIRIHPAYHAALHLREVLLPQISDDVILRVEGILEDLPEGFSFDGYQDKLKGLLDRIDYIPEGRAGASDYEEWVGELIKVCFFRSLTNIQAKERSYEKVVIRDWIASNRASAGFWRMVRENYGATQVVWECKNYADIGAEDFQQISYYLNDIAGRFAVIAYRAKEFNNSYYRHIARIADQKKMILLLNDKDLRVFIRQAINGKVKEDHISELFDRTVRAVS